MEVPILTEEERNQTVPRFNLNNSLRGNCTSFIPATTLAEAMQIPVNVLIAYLFKESDSRTRYAIVKHLDGTIVICIRNSPHSVTTPIHPCIIAPKKGSFLIAHMTKEENIESILKKGILPGVELGEKGVFVHGFLVKNGINMATEAAEKYMDIWTIRRVRLCRRPDRFISWDSYMWSDRTWECIAVMRRQDKFFKLF